jgi:hypothetical protein
MSTLTVDVTPEAHGSLLWASLHQGAWQLDEFHG